MTKLIAPEETPRGRFDGSVRYGPEFGDVYAAIANALRSAPQVRGSQQARPRMTKAQVAAIHRKVLAGEPLEEGQERDIADRLCRQLGGDPQAEGNGPDLDH